MAQIIQKQIQTHVQPDNKRVSKNNASYYLLKKTDFTTVIVECGFLSNYKEAENLIDEDYQQKLAWAIHLGILQYINEQIELLENKMEMASEKKTFLLKQIGLNTYEELTSELNNLQNELNKILALYEENKKAYDEIQ